MSRAITLNAVHLKISAEAVRNFTVYRAWRSVAKNTATATMRRYNLKNTSFIE